MNKILLALILTTSSVAYAGDYEENNNLMRLCKAHGTVAVDKWVNKRDGATLESELSSSNRDDIRGITKRVYSANFSNPKDAFMDAWARCMDENRH